jgi:hypothetical protein
MPSQRCLTCRVVVKGQLDGRNESRNSFVQVRVDLVADLRATAIGSGPGAKTSFAVIREKQRSATAPAKRPRQ